MSYLLSVTAGSVCGGGPQTIGKTFSNISDSHYIIECVSLPFKNKGNACVFVCVCVCVCMCVCVCVCVCVCMYVWGGGGVKL